MDGVVHYVRVQPPFKLRPRGHAARMQRQLSLAVKGHVSTVELYIVRPRERHKINADRPTDARKALRESGICELLGHGTSQPTQAIHSDAKKTPPLKLPVTGHDLRPLEQSRGGAWWPTVHGVRKPRLRHGKALPAAPTHVVELTRMFGFNRCACS